MAAVFLMALVGASLWSNARLREMNRRLMAEIDRSGRLREARDQAQLSERHATAARIRLASQAVDANHPERAQEILRDIPTNDGAARRSFAWRHLWHRARREVVLLVGPTPNFGHMTLSPEGRILATTDPTDGLVLRDAATGAPIRPLAPGPTRSGGQPSRRTARSSPRCRPERAPPCRTGSRSGRSSQVAAWRDCRSRGARTAAAAGSCPGEPSWARSSASGKRRPISPPPGTWRAIRGDPPTGAVRRDAGRDDGLEWRRPARAGIPGDGRPAGFHRGDDGPDLQRGSGPGRSPRPPARPAARWSPPCRPPRAG